MSQATARKRPKHLALHQIRQPLPAIISILHRVSGAGLFLCLPLLLWLFDRSLGSATAFDAYREVVGNPLVKLVLFGLLWAYLHHFCAGIRFLLLDVHVGDDLQPGRRSAMAVLVVSLLLTIVIGVALW
ncbi:succinate dehydrogenase, cytochrome b556 subunit [Pseudazoarcus pumilus]|uniref:Succinate dehydrogenase cytochrome b556 subunit n=1 Tax=Pseudazoarcus pumilus TaxID=2067960 RepID=A0A2I6S7B0_9RHOO|nr:succinate dehydrogenase, cytochrome b556 subunit [Pseudazoarcus pumilus]AUN95134.1 succinate dehydrogenase, cytochrome b556 subunit [Pseudazoarcus pumilus]